VKVIFVDNCCTVRKKLQEIFPDAEVCLNVFHWLQQWDKILVDKRSPESGLFRGLMKRTVLVVNNEEYKKKKEDMKRRLNRVPTVKEVLKECNTSSPTEEDAKRAVTAVFCS